MLFVFWWLVTGDGWRGSHSSLIICRFAGILSDTVPAPYPLRMRIEGLKSIKEMVPFSICRIALNVCAHNPALTDSETTLSGLDFMSLYLYKRKIEGKNEHSHVRFWLILVRQWKVGCFQLAICSDRLLTAFCKRLTSHLSLYLYNQKFYAKNEHFYH